MPHRDVIARRGPAVKDGAVAGLAADVTWADGSDGTLVVVSGGEVAVTITRNAETLHVQGPGVGEAEAPASGAVRVLVDGPVLEVSSAAGLFGAAITPVGANLGITTTSGSIDVHPLI